ncbi:hypothetical protein [Paenibacillus glufosinatiresistens]|nr:hypothetical protein [Paenibacillus sp. YX.27]
MSNNDPQNQEQKPPSSPPPRILKEGVTYGSKDNDKDSKKRP